MILAFDIGNTETTAALFDGANVGPHWRLTTNLPRTPDEYVLLLRSLLAGSGIDVASVAGSAICSVVPPATQTLIHACLECFGRSPAIIDARAALPITLLVDEPFTDSRKRVCSILVSMPEWLAERVSCPRLATLRSVFWRRGASSE